MSNAAHSREGHGASPWNKGHKVGQKRALRRQDVRKIRGRLRAEGHKRDLALFNLAIDSKLPGCDLVALKINDVWYRRRVRSHGSVVLQKTGLPVRFEITEKTRAAIADWLTQKKRSQIFLFPSRFHAQPHITSRQYARIVDNWVTGIGLDARLYGTHSIRRTKVALVLKQTGNLKAVQLLLGHKKLESTARYLETELTEVEALKIASKVEL